ncbi:MAG: tetratricopeptide repeat protein [Gammaproteobacteria bacterium]|nr:tetratricopeptide repeat protein [Gammaproteobacteria bacterium]
MRLKTHLVAPLIAYFLYGCASLSPPDLELLSKIDDFDIVQQRQDEFLALPDALSRLTDMRTYSEEVGVLYSTESLRLGPLGSALIAKHDASLNGHLVLRKFYGPLDEEAATAHTRWVERIKNHASHGRSGSLSKPYRALTIEDAHAFVVERGDSVIGSMYGENDEFPLVAYVIARKPTGDVEKIYFEIRSYERWRELTPDPGNAQPVDVIRELAQLQDNSAQVAYGIYLLENAASNPEQRDQIVTTGRNWLRTASNAPNALPSYFLANDEVAQRNERGVSWDRVKSRYERAIQLGYTDAQVSLGRLYLQGVFGSPERRIGLELFESAAEKNNVDAASALGALLLSQDPDDAIDYLRLAAELGDARHRLAYVRTVVHPPFEQQLSPVAFRWIEGLALDNNQEAMILLATIYAKGLYEGNVRIRQARSWYRRSVEVEPTDGQNVNEVAWVLATTHLRRLRNPTLAIKYMDMLMSNNAKARTSPEYIDTWAAAYAAAGDFRRAIELQEEAVAIAEESQSDVKQILELHLRNYQERKALTEKVP